MDIMIVDDEQMQRKQLSERIRKLFPSLNIVAECASADEATIALARFSPELVFLDVEMPGMTGFEFLESLSKINFSVIFTTSHAAYAVKAFRVAAVDFLLKPYAEEDLVSAIERCMDKQADQNKAHLDQLIMNLGDFGKNQQKIALPTSNGFVFEKIGEIVRVESQNTYSVFFLQDKKQIVVSRTLKECEEMLSDQGFIRIHQSHLINLAHIRRYIKGEGGTVEMDDNSKVEVSRRKKEEFIDALKRL